MNQKSTIRKPYGTIIALVAVVGYYLLNASPNPNPPAAPDPSTIDPATGRSLLEPAPFGKPVDGTMVESVGVVGRVLPDDNDGSRHQRFILKLANGQTLLVAHNIDLAPRVDNIQRGDKVRFRGQFEMNDRGGVIHWTHQDPRGEHPAGWLEHEGKRYE